jgi:hypothetical protein
MSVGIDFPVKAEKLITTGELEEALELCKAGVEKFPDYSLGKVMLAKVQNLMGDTGGAENTASEIAYSKAAKKVIQPIPEKIVESETEGDIVDEVSDDELQDSDSDGNETSSNKLSPFEDNDSFSLDLDLNDDLEEPAPESVDYDSKQDIEQKEDEWADIDLFDEASQDNYEISSSDEYSDLDSTDSLMSMEDIDNSLDDNVDTIAEDINEESIDVPTDDPTEVSGIEPIETSGNTDQSDLIDNNDNKSIALDRKFDYRDKDLIVGLDSYHNLTEQIEALEDDENDSFDDIAMELNDNNGSEDYEKDSELSDTNDIAADDVESETTDNLEHLDSDFHSEKIPASDSIPDSAIAAEKEDALQNDKTDSKTDSITDGSGSHNKTEPYWENLTRDIQNALSSSNDNTIKWYELELEITQALEKPKEYTTDSVAYEISEEDESESEEIKQISANEQDVTDYIDDTEAQNIDSKSDNDVITKDLVKAIKGGDYSVSGIKDMMNSLSTQSELDSEHGEIYPESMEMTETIAEILLEQEAFPQAYNAFKALAEIHPDKAEKYLDSAGEVKQQAESKNIILEQ